MRPCLVRTVRVVVGLAVAIAITGSSAGSVRAVEPGPGFVIDSFAQPTSFAPTAVASCESEGVHCDTYTVTAINTGSAATSSGSETKIVDTVPAGLTVQQVSFFWSRTAGLDLSGFCTTEATTPIVVKCRLPVEVGPDEVLKMVIQVAVEPGAPEALVNKAVVEGGGSAVAAVERRNVVAPSAASFGPSSFAFDIEGADGLPDRQAGDHSYEVTTTIGLNNSYRARGPESNGSPLTTSVQDVRDVVVDLPLGFVGSTLAARECTLAQLSGVGCPSSTIVGHIKTTPDIGDSVNSAIYNLVPEHGVPAEFGYVDVTHSSHVFYSHVVPAASGYVLQTMNSEVPQTSLSYITVTFYGDPGAKQEELEEKEGKTPSPVAHVPFFTNPTDCSGEELTATIYMDSWQNPARFNPDGTPANLEEPQWAKMVSTSPPMTGCDVLTFTPEITAQPTTHKADKPSGMDFEIKVPQSETVGVPGTPALKKAVVTLPEGFTIDPSAGDGLEACSEAQIGWLGGTRLNFSPAAPECPEASKIGSLELETPLVPHKFDGEMFLARQNENPFGSTLAAYVVVHDPITGVLVKIVGEFLPDLQTGRLTAVFDENPNLPFSDLKLHFFGGARAELATPESCGTFVTTTELFPYSAPDSGPAATPFDQFAIDEACPGGFSPSFTAGATNVQAGAYTPFVASFSRSDTDQELSGLTVTLPAGLLAKVAGVSLCGAAQIHAAETGTGGCPEASQVGTVEAGAGPGPNPLFVPGKAYLTGPYNGGPYGLAVVVPAIAGPFNFGTVVVRQSIRIDPRTAQVTDVSDAFPTIIDGIPLRLRRVDITLDRPQFTFNPTSCEKEAFAGAISGTPLGAPRELTKTIGSTVGYATQAGATSQFSTSFAVTDCAGLKFAPKLAVSTSARVSRANGANLTVKLTYPTGAWGSQANVRRVKVSLPKQLPSRLKTLQKACTAAQFSTNPAGCPAASIVGHAVVHTPVLPTALEGPAYFVSNGGEAFPNLIMVLQGDNVTVQLVGDTFISKKGITTSTFNGVPDVPFSSFELTLPKGAYSALAGNLPAHASGSFCKQPLTMPTVFDAQNGMVIEQNTKVHVNGCPKAKAAKHMRKKNHGKG